LYEKVHLYTVITDPSLHVRLSVCDNRHLDRYYILNIKYSDMLRLRVCHKGNFSFVNKLT